MDKRARGNIIVATRRFIDTQLDADVREKVVADLPEDIRKALPSVERGQWYPRTYASEQWAAIGRSESDPATALALLERTGRFIGRDATSTFLRLLVRLLTPSVFVKKFPRIWSKDFDFGKISTDASSIESKRIVLDIRDIAGFDHFAHTAKGWFTDVMETMGCQGVEASHDVSLEDPGPQDVQIRLSWQ